MPIEGNEELINSYFHESDRGNTIIEAKGHISDTLRQFRSAKARISRNSDNAQRRQGTSAGLVSLGGRQSSNGANDNGQVAGDGIEDVRYACAWHGSAADFEMFDLCFVDKENALNWLGGSSHPSRNRANQSRA